MNDPNRTLKWVFVIALVVLSLWSIYPPSEKLKGGIDLVGGTSLLLEIDTTGLDASQQSGLSRRVMEILRERVDPHGQLNLEWRPIGNTRIEIRMPRPPKEAIARRQAWEVARDELKHRNVTRFDIETWLNSDVNQRPSAVSGLVRGVAQREGKLQALATAFDARQALPDDALETDRVAAESSYVQAMDAALQTNLPLGRILDVFALGEGGRRDTELEKLRQSHAMLRADGEGGGLLVAAMATHDAWAKDKADLEDPSDLKRRLRGAGVLEFRILADRNPQSPTHTRDPNPLLQEPIAKYTDQLAQFGPRQRPGDHFMWLPVKDVARFLNVDDLNSLDTLLNAPGRPIVEEYAGQYYVLSHNDLDHGVLRSTAQRRWSLKGAGPDRNPLTGRNVVSFQLDVRGGMLFREMTGNNVERDMCILLDGQAMTYANIVEAIGERCQISGNFTLEEVQDMVRTLEAGSLPARVKETPLMEKTIGPSLGETNRNKGFKASYMGLILVAVFMIFYYGLVAGSMANLALGMNVLFILSVMAVNQWTFTLPGIAGLILTIGMAVDANVLIYERIREERDRGVAFRKALNAGYDKAFSTIMDANLTTLMTCIILGFVGSEEVKGFAITLGIGVTTSMFTALFVTRLIYNTLIAKGMLKDLHMRRFIHTPSIDWIGLRRLFLPASMVAVVGGLGLFLYLSVTDHERVFDIEFLGGTSVQLDLKPEHAMDDEAMRAAIVSQDGGGEVSAVSWLTSAGDELDQAEAADGEVAGRYTLTSSVLTAGQMGSLVRGVLEDKLERNGIGGDGNVATFDAKPGQLSLDEFKKAVVAAAEHARESAKRLSGARVQRVTDIGGDEESNLSYEIVTIESNRDLVQTAILAALGGKLAIQRAIGFTPAVDDKITKEPFFVVEAHDQYLSEVVDASASFDVRRFRGGVAIDVVLAPGEQPLTLAAFKRRLREVGLQPEFEQFQTPVSEIYPLGDAVVGADGENGYRRFAVVAVDESLLFEDAPVLWADSLARPQLALVKAALSSEKSLAKVVQFAPQVAGQAQNRAIMSIVLALAAIVAYIWMRFGNKEFGLAAIVALVHDVSVTLGMIGLSHLLAGTFIGNALGLTDFRIDLAMIAAILTVIGYSLNDTIVVFDRIRENRGRAGALTANLINTSINQTLSRTLLTSTTTLMVVLTLYIIGGAAVHGFAFALLIGVFVGTYSSIGIAAPLLYRPKVLLVTVFAIAMLGLIGMVLALVDHATARMILIGVIVLGCGGLLAKATRGVTYSAGRPVGA